MAIWPFSPVKRDKRLVICDERIIQGEKNKEINEYDKSTLGSSMDWVGLARPIFTWPKVTMNWT